MNSIQVERAIRQVNISEIQDIPVCTRYISSRLVDIMAAKARTAPQSIPPVLLGRVGAKLYPVNDFEAILGFKQANKSTIRAIIIDYTTLNDLIIDHVHRNLTPQTIDPLKLRDVAFYLVKSGMERSTLGRIFWMDKNRNFLNAMDCSITDETRDILVGMADEIAKKVHSVTIPHYFITMLSKIKDGEQAKAATTIRALTVGRMSSSKFFWPTPAMIKTLLADSQRRERRPVLDRLAKTNSNPSDEIIKKAQDMLKNDKNLIYIPTDGSRPDQILNIKTRCISEIKETCGVYKLAGDMARPVPILPAHIATFLNVQDGIPIRTFTTASRAIKALEKMDGRVRLAIMVGSE